MNGNLVNLMEHKQVEIVVLDDKRIEVDAGLEDVIKNFCDWGIFTSMSCIDNFGSVWIQINNGFCCNKFLELALYNKTVQTAAGIERDNLWDFLKKNAR